MNQPAPQLGLGDLQQLIAAIATILHQAEPMVPPERLAQFVQFELQAQDALTQVVDDLVTPAAREKHPFWGFFIAGTDSTGRNVEIARTHIPKALTPMDNPEYLAQVAAWTNAYMLVTSPAARAAWRALGYAVTFFQSETDRPKPSPLITS